MKKMSKILLVALLVAGFAGVAAQAEPYLQVLGTAGRASYNATHVYRLTYSAFTNSTTNSTQSFSIPIDAGTIVELVCMKLDRALDTANTNYTGSCALKVGDGGDDDQFLASTELASDGTEVWTAFGRTCWNSGSATNVTLAYGTEYYAAATNVYAVFTPNEEEALDDNTSGEVSLYFNLIQK
jgi:hypothetical protein